MARLERPLRTEGVAAVRDRASVGTRRSGAAAGMCTPMRAAVVEGSRGASGAREAVTISVVPDVAKFLAERSLPLHGDVVDGLVTLVVALLDGEDADEGPSR